MVGSGRTFDSPPGHHGWWEYSAEPGLGVRRGAQFSPEEEKTCLFLLAVGALTSLAQCLAGKAVKLGGFERG